MVQLTKWGELTFDHASLRILNNRTAFCFRHGERRSAVWQQRCPSLATQANRELSERRVWSSFRKIYGEMIPFTVLVGAVYSDWNCKLALCIVSRALSHRYDLQRVLVYDSANVDRRCTRKKSLAQAKPHANAKLSFSGLVAICFPTTYRFTFCEPIKNESAPIFS